MINPTVADIGRSLKLHGSWRGKGILRDFDRHWIYVENGSEHGIATLRDGASWDDAPATRAALSQGEETE